MTRASPYFSVVSAVKEPTASVAELLSSLLRQTEGSWEWIVQEAGTSQLLHEAVVAEEDARILHAREPDSGIYDGLNRALARASGRYVVILGSDDRLASDDVLAQLRATIESTGTEPELVLGAADVGDRTIFTSSIGPRTLLLNTVHHQGAAYKRSQFDRFSFDASSKVVADYEHSLRLYLERASRVKTETVIAVCGAEGVSRTTRESRLYQDMHEIRSRYLPTPFSKVLQAVGMANVIRRRVQRRSEPQVDERRD